MQFINTFSYYINMIGVITIVTLLLMVGVLYYLIKIKKVTARQENINTANFKREDSVNYVPFKDIVSRDGNLDSDGMIVINDTVFVGGITVRGYDYPSASGDEKIASQVNSVTFFNVVEKPTSFRQSIRAVDLSTNIEEYQQTLKSLKEDLFQLELEHEETKVASEEYVNDEENYGYYRIRLQELSRQIQAKQHMAEECNIVLHYMEALSTDADRGNGSHMGQRTNQIMFSYIYNADEFTQPLSKEEIYVKAMDELGAIAVSYGEALAACHFRSKRLSARDLIGLMRKHTSPVTGEALGLDELLDSSYTSLFVSSDSLVEAFKERIGERILEERLLEKELQTKALLERQIRDRYKQGEMLLENAYERALSEMGLEE